MKKEEEIKPIYCDVCGRSMWSKEANANVIGVWLSGPGEKAFNESASTQEVYPELTKHHYVVCWVCWLKSFGIKEL